MNPVSALSNHLLLVFLEGERLSEVLEGIKVSLIDCSLGTLYNNLRLFGLLEAVLSDNWGEQRPAAVEENIAGELLQALILLHISSMDSNDVSHPLANRQVLELLGEEHQSAMLDDSL